MQKNSDKTSDRTKIPRMQLFRMARIVALLKKNRLPVYAARASAHVISCAMGEEEAKLILPSEPDFSVEFEPHATLLEEKGDGYVVASLGEDSGYVPYTSFCAKKSYLETNADTVQKFTNALQKGMDYVQTHSPEEIAEVIAPQFAETDIQTLTTIVKRYHEQDSWKADLIFEEESFDLLQNILQDAAVIEERVPYADLVNTEFATEAAK